MPPSSCARVHLTSRSRTPADAQRRVDAVLHRPHDPRRNAAEAPASTGLRVDPVPAVDHAARARPRERRSRLVRGPRGCSRRERSRSIAKVGRVGSGVSKNWTGKLLAMPPSENQHTSARERVRRRPAALDRLDRFARCLSLVMSSARRGTALIGWGSSGSLRGHDHRKLVGRGEGQAAARGPRAGRGARSPSRPTPGGGWARLHPGDDPLREEAPQLDGVEQELPVRPRHPVRAAMRDVRRHHLEVASPLACRSPKVSGPAARPSFAGEVVDQVGEPRRERGCGASFGREAGAETEAVLAERSRQADRKPQAERDREPEQREHDPCEDRANGEVPDPVQRARTTSATPGVSPTVAVNGKLRSAAPATRSRLPAPFRPSPEVRRRKNGPRLRLRLEEVEEVLPGTDPLARAVAKPAVLGGRALGGRPPPAAAIAPPADVPADVLANRYVRASSQRACG